MATTPAWIQANRYGEYAFVLAFDGIDLLVTTTSDTSGIATAWSATDWTYVTPGLDYPSEITQDITLFKHEINAGSLTFTVSTAGDTSNFIAPFFFAPNRSMTKTYLTATCDNNDTALTVKSSTGFADGSTLYVGHEAMVVNTRPSATSISITTRGKFSLWAPNGGSRFGRRHEVQPSADAHEAYAPIVSTAPRLAINRRVALYMHHKEGGVWSTNANALCLWAGTIRSYGEDPAELGKIKINCTDIKDVLQQSVLGEQFKGDMRDGMYLLTHVVGIGVATSISGTDHSSSAKDSTFDGTGETLTCYEVANKIAKKLNEWYTAGTIASNYRWGIEIVTTDLGDTRTRITVDTLLDITMNADNFQMGLHPNIWRMLGFSTAGQAGGEDANGRTVTYLDVRRVGNAPRKFVRQSDRPPVSLVDPIHFANSNTKFTIDDEEGTWLTQPTGTIPGRHSGAEGLMQIGSHVAACTYDSSTKLVTFRTWATDVAASPSQTGGSGVQGGSTPLQVKQVWCERGSAGDILLKLLLSTGVSGYNDSTYDVNTAQMGLGIPYSLVDVPSFQSIDDRYELYLTGPRSVGEILATILAATSRYLIWKDGKITVSFPGYDSPSTFDYVELTEANKAVPNEPSTMQYSLDGMVNRVRLKHYTLDDGRSKSFFQQVAMIAQGTIPHLSRPDNSYSFDLAPSITDFGQKKAIEIDGAGILDPDGWREHTAATAFAFFGRPLAYIERTYDPTVWHLTVGDIVRLTDDRLLDPADGARGISGLGCFVLSTKIDPRTGIGRCRLAFIPDHPASRYATYAPSALCTGYTAATKVATFSANVFTPSSTGLTDIDYFSIGDKVALIELSPTTAASPSRFTGEIQSKGTNQCTFTIDITGGAGLTAGKTYVMEYQAYSACTAAQQAKCFVASTSDKINTTVEANRWGTASNGLNPVSGSPTYTSMMVKPTDRWGDSDEPLSAHKLYYLFLSLNNLFAYKTSQVLINQVWVTPGMEQTGSTEKLIFGPIKVPVTGMPPGYPITRNCDGKVLIRANTGGTAKLTLYSSDQPVRGSSTTVLVLPARYSSTSVTTTSTTSSWQDITDFTPTLGKEKHYAYTWFWATINNTGGGANGVRVRGLMLQEGPPA